MRPPASIVVPTRGRPEYLAVALASIAPQAAAVGAEVVVIEDGPVGPSAAIATRHGAGYRALGARHGLNVARNAGLRASSGELVVYVDDDVEVRPGWLAALLAAARAEPAVDVFTGPIHARVDGWRDCGRDAPPITSLALGSVDCWAPHAWGANMAIRRPAFATAGEFDARRSGGGDEEEWQRRHGGPIRYVAAAALDHRRSGSDARLPALARAAFARGVEVRRFDAEGTAPRIARELRVLAGCLWHAATRRCPNGLVMAAHSGGRVHASLVPAPSTDPGGAATASDGTTARGRATANDRAPTGADEADSASAASRTAPDDFVSGESGTVGGRRDLLRRLGDGLLDVELRRRPVPAARGGSRQVLVLTVERPENRDLVARAGRELARSRHAVTRLAGPAGGVGKFENVNALLATAPAAGYDWLVIVDDDVELPRRFLDRFLALAEHFELRLAQPAHRLQSHAAWRLTRRRPGALVRETRFVEIGPVTALRRDTFGVLLPFPELRMGWGLDAHWAALAAARGWRIGIVDATPIAHLAAPAGAAYPRQQALAEAREFLADHAYLPAAESQRTLAVHRRCA